MSYNNNMTFEEAEQMLTLMGYEINSNENGKKSYYRKVPYGYIRLDADEEISSAVTDLLFRMYIRHMERST